MRIANHTVLTVEEVEAERRRCAERMGWIEERLRNMKHAPVWWAANVGLWVEEGRGRRRKRRWRMRRRRRGRWTSGGGGWCVVKLLSVVETKRMEEQEEVDGMRRS